MDGRRRLGAGSAIDGFCKCDYGLGLGFKMVQQMAGEKPTMIVTMGRSRGEILVLTQLMLEPIMGKMGVFF